MEFHALAQGEGIGLAVRREIDLLGQQGLWGAAFVIADETLDHLQGEVVGAVVAVDAGIDAADIGLDGDSQRLREHGTGQQRDEAKAGKQTVHGNSPGSCRSIDGQAARAAAPRRFASTSAKKSWTRGTALSPS